MYKFGLFVDKMCMSTCNSCVFLCGLLAVIAQKLYVLLINTSKSTVSRGVILIVFLKSKLLISSVVLLFAHNPHTLLLLTQKNLRSF